MKQTIISVVLLLACLNSIAAREGYVDPLLAPLEGMFELHEEKTLCKVPNKGMKWHSDLLYHLLVNVRKQQKPSREQIAHATWTLYPCPFRPDRKLRFANENDIIGTWIFPHASQHLRFAKLSKRKSLTFPSETTCEIIGYYDDNELRTLLVAEKNNRCTIKNENDFAQAKKLPLASKWKLVKNGRLQVTRTDISNHIEEWDIFVVIEGFEVGDVTFKSGDLVSYLRKENGNERYNASTQFRHLSRLSK